MPTVVAHILHLDDGHQSAYGHDADRSHTTKPQFAIGGAGGRKIPNSIFSVLRPWLAVNTSLDDAVAAPRMHTEGTLTLELTGNSAPADKARLETLGYTVRSGGSAVLAAQATF
ncbi:MAG: gamma-glutamyltransferase [Planctomycetaceae bacterium]